ncbi:hypothetical protein RvY_01781 [Ramazzottius varieornatus]|uniref:DUF659 domain-containing protein n=1 Tax=Ramazzottius varieornatus TaxID=947166 RepID=A0A1D1US86_RAMVA|nr:hypothetical protein RvY_01781 [Ramazzottius varieornatus]
MAATEIVIDEDNDVEASDASSGDRDRKAKEFYSTFFSSLATARESKNSKSYVVHSGNCRLCPKEKKIEKKISSRDGYSNFKSHVLTFHNRNQEVVTFCASSEEAKRKADNGTFVDYFPSAKKKRLGRKHPQQIRLDEAVALIQWSKRHRIVKTLLPAQYVNIKAALVRLLDKADAVAMIIDIWSSKRQRGYLGISVHFIDENFRFLNFLLAGPRFKGSHTAEAILNLTVEVIADYGLPRKIFYVGTDNGSNIICAFKDWFQQFYGFNSPADSSDDDSLQQESHQEDIQELEETAADDEEFDPVDPEELDVDNNLANEVAELLLQKYCLLPERKILVRCVPHSLQLVVKKPVKNCAVGQ